MSFDLSGIVSASGPMTSTTVSTGSAEANPAQAMIDETQAPATEEKAKPSLDHVEKFNALARRERMLQQKERELKEKEERYKPLEGIKERARKEPLKVMEELGLTYDELTNTILNDGKAPAEMGISDVKSELEALKKELAQEREEKTNKENQQKAQEYRSHIKDHIKGKDEYEYISTAGDEAIDLICDTVVSYYQEHQKVLSEDEVCKLVEDYYEAQAEKYLNLKKLRSKLGLSVESEKTAPSEPAKTPQVGQTKTLTNSMSPETKPQASLLKDDEQSLKQVAAMLRWQK